VGFTGRNEEAGFFGQLILEQQADRLPRDRDVAMREYFVDDPTGRRPAKRSNRVDPEFDVLRSARGVTHV
jgi:hypothetical protein